MVREVQNHVAIPDGSPETNWQPPIELENRPRAYSFSEPSELLSNVEGDNGSVRIVSEAPPVASCFFYMH